jgi:hypothetical protein
MRRSFGKGTDSGKARWETSANIEDLEMNILSVFDVEFSSLEVFKPLRAIRGSSRAITIQFPIAFRGSTLGNDMSCRSRHRQWEQGITQKLPLLHPNPPSCQANCREQLLSIAGARGCEAMKARYRFGWFIRVHPIFDLMWLSIDLTFHEQSYTKTFKGATISHDHCQCIHIWHSAIPIWDQRIARTMAFWRDWKALDWNLNYDIYWQVSSAPVCAGTSVINGKTGSIFLSSNSLMYRRAP